MHPSEGMWQEFLDDQCEPTVQRELAIHAPACSDCQRVLAALGRRRVLVAGLLDQLDGRVPERSLTEVLGRQRLASRRSRQSLLAAAVVAFCVVTAAGATVRAGLFQRAMTWLLGPAPQVESQFPPARPVVPEGHSSTGITLVAASSVEIAFEQWPPRGEIEIALRPVAEVSVTASVPTAYSVRKGKVLVDNRGVTTSYRVVLPKNIPLASIRVGNRIVLLKHGALLTTQARKTGLDSYLLSFSSETDSP